MHRYYSAGSDSSDVSMYSETTPHSKDFMHPASGAFHHKRFSSSRMAPSPRELLAKSVATQRQEQTTDDIPAQILEANGQAEAAALFRKEGIDSEFAREELLGDTARQELKFLGLSPKQCIKVARVLKKNAHRLSEKPSEEQIPELKLPKSQLAQLDVVSEQEEDSEDEVEQAPRRLRTVVSLSRDPNFRQSRGSMLAMPKLKLLNSVMEAPVLEENSEDDSDFGTVPGSVMSLSPSGPATSVKLPSPPPLVPRTSSGGFSSRSATITPRGGSVPPPTPGAQVQKRLLSFLAELSTEIQDGSLSEKLFDGTPERERMNTSQLHWETLKNLFPLKRNTMSRLRSDAEKFTYNPKYTNDMGYPTNASINSSEFSRLFENINLNNIGSPYHLEEMGCIRNTRNYEREILDQIAVATGAHPDEVTGYITHGGTEAALYGLWNGRQRLEIASGGVLPVLYYSAECHYSCAKIANILGLVGEKVDYDSDRSMSVSALKEALARHPGKPAMIVATIGTTFLEAVDHVPAIKETLELSGVPHWIHADAAYLGMVLPFLKNPSPRFADFCWSWKGGIDSISISGHKFCGTNVPCGIGMVRKPADGKMAGMGVQEYANVNDNTISGCRNGNVVLELWLTFQRFWREGFEYIVAENVARAESAYQKLEKAGLNPWRFDKQSMSIVFDRPANQELCEFFHLMCRGDRCHVMAHNTSPEDMDILLEAIEASKAGLWSPPEYIE